MPYWVYGKDATGKPSEPFFCDAESAEAAREEALTRGITVEEVEFVEGPAVDKEPEIAEYERRTVLGILKASPQVLSQASPQVLSQHNRGVKWLVAGAILIAVSYVVSLGLNEHITSGSMREAFSRAQRLSWLLELTRLGLFAGIASAAAGGIMWIVDTSPNRRGS